MSKKTLTLTIALILAGFSFTGNAQTTRENLSSFDLLFRTGSYPVAENIQQFAEDFQALASGDEVIYRIVQFHEIPDRLKREMLAEAGIILLDYIPNMAYYAAISGNANIHMLQQMKARAVVEIQPAYRLDFDLYTGNYPEHALRPENRIKLNVHYFQGIEKNEIISLLSVREIHFVDAGYIPGYIQVSSPIDMVNWLGSYPKIESAPKSHFSKIAKNRFSEPTD
jgi:hypothetical protein